MQSWNLDPHKRDYVMDNGAPVETNSLQVPAFFRLRVKRKQWMYAPDDRYGSDYFTILRQPPDGGKKLENVGLAALKPIIDDGRASSVTVTTDTQVRGGAALTTTIVDASGEEETVTFTSLGV